MESNYKQLGRFIRQIDLRNDDAGLGEDNLYGISVTKEFIVSHANLVGVTFDSYKVVAPRQFAYIPDTSRRGDKIAISLNMSGKRIIVSSICTVFEIVDEDQLLPEYLMLWFMRPEFDRYARFMSNGSAREVFDWGCMCGVELPVPPLPEQQRIVRDYQVITERIGLLQKMNDNLEMQSKERFSQLMDDADGMEGVFSDVIQIMGGGTPSTTVNEYWNGDIPFFTPGDIDGVFCLSTAKSLTSEGLKNCSSRLYRKNTTFITCRGTVGKVALAGIPMAMNQTCYALTGKDNYPDYFVFEFIKYFVDSIKRKANGGVFDAITTKDFESEKVTIPSLEQALEYERSVKPFFELILSNEAEIISLDNIRLLLMSVKSKGA